MLVLIDNYDSFTYNLVHYFKEIGQEVLVYRNDQKKVEEILNLKPDFVVISPGPSKPTNAGICIDLVKEIAKKKIKVPILGVCLGHQVIAETFGGKVIQSGKPIHGKVSKIFHKNSKLFSKISNPFNATRYHSLIVDKQKIPNCLDITASTEDETIMAVEHKDLDIFGVQFHPESISTDSGHQLLKNFLKTKK
ncbi:MAG: anthranilate/aminodeoxychorismate synthase component II [Rickettsiales bacterium]|nr:anthranilate/aminodeoxychorismate synthase component II [Rickettsiales bacterium]